jgi:hypothetical protein
MRHLLLLALIIAISSAIQAQPSVEMLPDSVHGYHAPCLYNAIKVSLHVVNHDSVMRVARLYCPEYSSPFPLPVYYASEKWAPDSMKISPGDTIFRFVMLPYDTVVRHLILSSDTSIDTLFVTSSIGQAKLILEGDLDFGAHPRAAPLPTKKLRLINRGDIDQPLNGLRMNSSLLEPSISLNDTIYAHDTLEFSVTLMNSGDLSITHSNSCSQIALGGRGKLYTPLAHFTEAWNDDTLVGCKITNEKEVHSVLVKNSLPFHVTTIDSITYSGSPGVTYDKTAWQRVVLHNGDTRPFVYSALRTVKKGRFQIHTSEGLGDYFDVSYTNLYAQPSISWLGTDTLSIKPGQSPLLSLRIVNDGNVNYDPRIELVHQLGNLKVGSIEGLKLVLPGSSIKVNLKLDILTSPGIYSGILRVTGSPCDTVMERPFAIQVSEPLSVRSTEQLYEIRNVDNGLNISYDQPFRYSLFNVAGTLLRTANSEAESCMVDMRNLPSGLYFMLVQTGEHAATRSFLWSTRRK